LRDRCFQRTVPGAPVGLFEYVKEWAV
jgi:hypothetical protein